MARVAKTVLPTRSGKGAMIIVDEDPQAAAERAERRRQRAQRQAERWAVKPGEAAAAKRAKAATKKQRLSGNAAAATVPSAAPK